MYNEKQKLDFISSYTTSDKTAKLLKQIFNRTEKYEEEFGVDLSQATAEQLQEYFDNNSKGIRAVTNELTLSLITKYVNWCKIKGYDTSTGVYNVRLSTIENAKQAMVSSPYNLKQRLDEYFDSPDDNTIDVVFRVFLWMAFAGLKDTDALRVESKNVDFDNLLIHFEGHDYEIYEESRDDFNKACNLLSFVYTHVGKYCYEQNRNRAGGDRIMRGYKEQTDILTLRPTLNRALAQTKLEKKNGQKIGTTKARISYHKIQLSGIFYRKRRLEINGYGVDFSDIVAKKMSERDHPSPTPGAQKYTADLLTRRYEDDYTTWKCAFPL